MFLPLGVDLHPVAVVLKHDAASLEAANEQSTVRAAHVAHVVGIARVCVQPALVEVVPQLLLRLTRERLVVHLQRRQIAVIVLAATLLGRLAVTRISLLTAAAAGATPRSHPLVVVLAALVAEWAVLPEARIAVLAPARGACGKRSLKSLRLRAHDLPLIGRAYAALALNGCSH